MHEPVMVAEVLEHLAPARGGVFVDCTVGYGGHTRAMLHAGAARVIGLDRDPDALRQAAAALVSEESRVELVHSDYRRLDEILDARGITGVDGILADLGVSSMQLDEAGRGFSFRRDEPLDMRMDRTSGLTAAEMIRDADERTLADVIYEFGEERHARRIARAIVEARDRSAVDSTGRLAEVVRRAVPRKGYSRIDPATRTFQAVRIWVNRELEGLDVFLTQAARRLRPGGRMAVIAFHSLEDRIVKHTLRSLQATGDIGLTIRTKRPVVPSEAEVERNPRARSAKLRVAERGG
ncbi:MAG TPA: 16S rRNA (cytosine(1402)-N(4))-methyltransferase RsmH [Vicinamibacterales bacterium]|jgi:16S rRNA (cytosine1402-N4)-methyltransferase|nr:16S rRNA (cytosine(1402)-N(4))-methyltransferase RsmH [Vicinamibacterales bacterium]